jgi:hypothetical protein
MAAMLHGRGIDLLPRLSDLRGQVSGLALFAQKSYERVRG